MCLPSWFVITALRRTFSAGIVKAYIDSSNTIGKNVSKCTLTDSLILTGIVCCSECGDQRVTIHGFNLRRNF
jgi:hypothetical protein